MATYYVTVQRSQNVVYEIEADSSQEARVEALFLAEREIETYADVHDPSHKIVNVNMCENFLRVMT